MPCWGKKVKCDQCGIIISGWWVEAGIRLCSACVRKGHEVISERKDNMTTDMQFWLVYVEGASPPRYRHETLEKAAAEAEQLAKKEGRPVYVLAPVRICQRNPITVEWQENPLYPHYTPAATLRVDTLSGGGHCRCGRPLGHEPDAACTEASATATYA